MRNPSAYPQAPWSYAGDRRAIRRVVRILELFADRVDDSFEVFAFIDLFIDFFLNLIITSSSLGVSPVQYIYIPCTYESPRRGTSCLQIAHREIHHVTRVGSEVTVAKDEREDESSVFDLMDRIRLTNSFENLSNEVLGDMSLSRTQS